MSRNEVRPTLPWWRVRMVWLVIGGPALVVLASIVTVVLALKGADRPLQEAAPQAKSSVASDALTPATQARNHAVTPAR